MSNSPRLTIEEMIEDHLRTEGKRRVPVCIDCKQPFTASNVFTADGWKEVNISQTCERCFDNLFDDKDD
jgi:hypothetical protein